MAKLVEKQTTGCKLNERRRQLNIDRETILCHVFHVAAEDGHATSGSASLSYVYFLRQNYYILFPSMATESWPITQVGIVNRSQGR
jgi:hypothetical protein